MIHHQPDARKRKLFQEIHDILIPGGIFINLEHVASSTPASEQLFVDYYTDYLHDFQVQAGQSVSKKEVAESITNRPDKNEDTLSPVDLKCRWLREAGFSDVDCFFKLFEIALFGGRKTESGKDSADN